MTVIIDADGCPVTDITVKVCRERCIDVLIVADTAHEFNIDGVERLIADKGADSADYIITARVKKGDLVVTQDYGLAAMCLVKGASVLRQDGLRYTDCNIDALLRERYENKKAAKAKVKLKKPKKRTSAEDEAFEKALRNLL